MSEREFLRWGWGAFLGTIWLVYLLVDTLVTTPGGMSIITHWHGAPWYLLLFFPLLVAHIFTLTILLQLISEPRGAVSSARWLLVACLSISLLLFHGLFWDNGHHVLGLLVQRSAALPPAV